MTPEEQKFQPCIACPPGGSWLCKSCRHNLTVADSEQRARAQAFRDAAEWHEENAGSWRGDAPQIDWHQQCAAHFKALAEKESEG